MKIVVQAKLLPGSAHDADALAATLRACSRAANRVSQVAFRTGKVRRNELQKETYYALKADFDLGAQPGVRTIKKVCDAYATLKGTIKSGQLSGQARRKALSKPIAVRRDAARPYDDRILTWNLDTRTVSIWTVAGRIKNVPFVCSEPSQQARFSTAEKVPEAIPLGTGVRLHLRRPPHARPHTPARRRGAGDPGGGR